MKDEIVNWLREEVKQAKAKGLIFGLSGGVDSAVTGVLSKQALAEKTLALVLPCHSQNKDVEDAKLIAKKFGIKYKVVNLSPIYDTLVKTLPPANRLTSGNLKPRLRMMTLYYFANKLNYLVTGTGNKSELMVGYFTKYGDGGVDLLPLGNLYKTEVRKLAEELSIPKKVIYKTPSAGLWEGQTDENEMGTTYNELDKILASLETGREVKSKKVQKIKSLMKKTEHKRSGPKIFKLGITTVIKDQKLYKEIERKARALEVISEVSKTIVSERYLKEILNSIVATVAQMMGTKICSIMFLDEEKQELSIVATQSLSETYIKKPPLKVGQSISGRVVKEKRPFTVLDVTEEKGYMYPEIAKKEGLVSMLSVPMMIREHVIGVINSYTSTRHKFTDDEIKTLQIIANQAAITIENTRLMEETLAMRDTLETRKLVERAKGILMKEQNLSEQEAFRCIQKKSMDTRKSMKQIAEAIILASELQTQK